MDHHSVSPQAAQSLAARRNGDAEFNGFGGQPISSALVPEDPEGLLLFEALPCTEPETWVVHCVRPVLRTRPISLPDMIAKMAECLRRDPESRVTADWPEDVAHAALLMVTGLGFRAPSPRFIFELLDLALFDSELPSDLPHSTLWLKSGEASERFLM